MQNRIRKALCFTLCVVFLISISGCGSKKEDDESEKAALDAQIAEQEAAQQQIESVPVEEPEPKPFVYEVYQFDESKFVEYSGVVEHIFFHPLVAYPKLAFDGDNKAAGIDDWMVTVDEFNKILDNLYEKGYILVNWNDVWGTYVNESGETRMKKNTLRLPEGRKPLIMSIDDANYYEYMLENGFTYKLILGDDGEIWSWGLDPDGNEVISQDLDIITILDKFVKEHPDFSLNGTKACLALTGYEGILGYRTNTDTKHWTDEDEAYRLTEVEKVKPIVEQLKRTGWYFGSHTWGHLNLSNKSVDSVERDMTRWNNEVGSIIGDTQLMIYPHGGRPDGNDVSQTGPVFKYLYNLGFRMFASVGIESYSKCKSDICAVICDRLHPDGTTLRWARSRYLQFYDAKDIFDFSVRPDYGYDFSK